MSTGWRAQPERQRRCDSESSIFGDIATGDIPFIAHHVQPECRAVAERGQRLIHIERDTTV